MYHTLGFYEDIGIRAQGRVFVRESQETYGVIHVAEPRIAFSRGVGEAKQLKERLYLLLDH